MNAQKKLLARTYRSRWLGTLIITMLSGFTLQKLHYSSSPFNYHIIMERNSWSWSRVTLGTWERVSSATWAFSRYFSPHLKLSTEQAALDMILSLSNRQTILKALDRSPLSTSRLLNGGEHKPNIEGWKGFPSFPPRTWISLILEILYCASTKAAWYWGGTGC